MRLTQVQVKESLSELMTEPDGIRCLTELFIEIAMEGERELYKEESGDLGYSIQPIAPLHYCL